MDRKLIMLLSLIAAVFILHLVVNHQKQKFLKEAQNYRKTRNSNYKLKDPLEWSKRIQNNTNYPVDVVFTWVDGSDPNFIAIKNKFMKKNSSEFLPEDAIRDNRWADNGELLQSIQSVKTYAPWVRNIYVVVGMFQVPSWYPENHKDVIFVDHSEVFGKNVDTLPVFNSHAIEANIWRIPGLSEHFIYFNDDMFLGKPLTKDDFFADNGQKFILYTDKPIQIGYINREYETYLSARQNTGNLFNELFGQRSRPLTYHFSRPLLKSVCKKSWDHPTLFKYLNDTSKSRFRDHDDVAPIELFSLHGLETGRAEVGFMSDNFNTGIPTVSHLIRSAKKLSNGTYSMYCINDSTAEKTDDFTTIYTYILETKLPHHQSVLGLKEDL